MLAHWFTPWKGLPLYEAVVPAPPEMVVDGLDEVVVEPALVVLALEVVAELVLALEVVDDVAAVVVLDVVAAPGRHWE